MNLKKMIMFLLLPGILLILVSATLQQKPWVIPEKYKKMKNPLKSTPAAISAGKIVWDKHCKSCHGSAGKGDGVKAKTLRTHSGDFTTPKVQGQPDGDMYYKSFVGRDEMPNFEKKIPDETDRWNVILFIRSLK